MNRLIQLSFLGWFCLLLPFGQAFSGESERARVFKEIEHMGIEDLTYGGVVREGFLESLSREFAATLDSEDYKVFIQRFWQAFWSRNGLYSTAELEIMYAFAGDFPESIALEFVFEAGSPKILKANLKNGELSQKLDLLVGLIETFLDRQPMLADKIKKQVLSWVRSEDLNEAIFGMYAYGRFSLEANERMSFTRFLIDKSGLLVDEDLPNTALRIAAINCLRGYFTPTLVEKSIRLFHEDDSSALKPCLLGYLVSVFRSKADSSTLLVFLKEVAEDKQLSSDLRFAALDGLYIPHFWARSEEKPLSLALISAIVEIIEDEGDVASVRIAGLNLLAQLAFAWPEEGKDYKKTSSSFRGLSLDYLANRARAWKSEIVDNGFGFRQAFGSFIAGSQGVEVEMALSKAESILWYLE